MIHSRNALYKIESKFAKTFEMDIKNSVTNCDLPFTRQVFV